MARMTQSMRVERTVGLPDEPPRARPRRRWLRVFLYLLGFELVVVAAVSGWLVWTARAELLAAREGAARGQAAVQALDLDVARAEFSGARADFESGAARLHNPVVDAMALLPVARENILAARALGEAGTNVASAADDLVSIIAEQPGGLEALLPRDGLLPVDVLADLAEVAATAEERLATAAALTEAAPRTGLVDQVSEAQLEFDQQLAEARDLVGAAADASSALAAVLGSGGERRYLLGAQSLAELRGTGGFIGAYAIATFDRGRFELGDFAPIQELESFPVSAMEPPNPDYAARYDRYGGAGFWQAINATPDFPSAALAMVRLYEKSEGVELDGVVAVDPFALRALLEIVGEVEVRDVGAVGAMEVVPVVANEAYDVLGAAGERKEILGEVAAGALDRLLRGQGFNNPRAVIDGLAPVIRDRHLMMYSTDEQVQAALTDLGIAGELPAPDHDVVSVVVNNAAVNKVDFYVNRLVEYEVALQPDRSARARLRVTFQNQAPAAGITSHVIGPNTEGLQAGDDLSLVSLFCGRCEPTAADPPLAADGDDGFRIEQELGHTVVTTLLTVPRAEERSVELEWDLRDAWTVTPDGGCYAFTYLDQPTLRTTQITVRVQAPSSMTIASGEKETDQESRIVYAGPLSGILEQEICFTSDSVGR